MQNGVHEIRMPSSGPPYCSPAMAPWSGRPMLARAGIHTVRGSGSGRSRDFGRARTSQRISAPGAADTGGIPSGTKPRRWARTATPRSPPRARHLLIRAACSRGEYQRSAPPAPPPRRLAPAALPHPYPRHARGAAAAPQPPQPYAGRAQVLRRRAKPARPPSPVRVNALRNSQIKDGVPAPQERAQRGARVPDLWKVLPGRRD